jgi:hypothetical protein
MIVTVRTLFSNLVWIGKNQDRVTFMRYDLPVTPCHPQTNQSKF